MPNRRNARRTRTRRPRNGGRSRRTSTMRNVRARNYVRVPRVNAHNSLASGGDAVPVSHYGAKMKTPSKKKVMAKIRKPLYNAIKKIASVDELRGVYEYRYTYAFSKAQDNLQSVTNLYGGTTCDGIPGFFLPTDFIHAASVNWNKKTDSATRLYTDAGNFSFETIKIKVINAYASHTIRNNTTSEAKIRVYTFAPKKEGAARPDTMWANAYARATTAGKMKTGADITQIGEGPFKFPEITANFRISCDQFTLGPGQTKVLVTQGPKDKLLTLNSQYEITTYNSIAPYSRFCIGVYEQQIGADIAGNCGRYTNNNAGYGIIVETVVHYKLAMPEQVGFTYPAAFAAGTQQILNRYDTWYKYNYSAAQVNATLAQTNEGFDAAAVTTQN